ncbi:TPA: hypothetical protein L5X86_005694 [Pseudomonas aeruginosa]|nr:hypothetical protein [Pseudomonas aeruginosa]HBP2870744.1 hypothetical protein [Pseudomonas aeruginosa]HBP2936868.1 hypothetical protein [Pseudomonas aeruginosa]
MIISKGNLIKFVAAPLGMLALGFGLFNGVFFYNEAGFMTHVRTIFGDEKIVDDVGYATKWFGRATTWKKAISVQSVLVMDDNDTNPDNDGLGATIEAFPIVFLGNVDAKVESSARFRLPGGEPFLKMAQEYRNPDNFIRTALVPAIKETLQATASLMSADDYYAGARSEFAAEFENQLNDGLYLIKRKEVRGPRGAIPHQTAILQAGTEQGAFGDNNASQFVTEKVTDAKGIPVRKQQQFRKFGVEVVEARITNVDPNPQYKQRMVKVQQALAELAVARQNRLKEEEEKLLVTARGEKEVEAKRQETLRDQIERTTQAETDKQLAVINAEREKQRAEIEKQTAELLRDKATVTAQATKITADAEAYAREAVIKADGALQPKLDALIAINKVWAEAAAQAPVPSVMMGAGANGAASRQDEIGQLMGVLATKAARDLALGSPSAALEERGASELVEVARAFNTMHERIDRYLNERGQLFSAISHDLRTPITRLRLRVELLEDERLQEKFGRDLDELELLVKGALQCVKDTDIHENVEPVDLNLLLQHIAEPYLADGRVEVVGRAAEPYPGKPLALKRCIGNLLDNALKYGERARLSLEDGPEAVVLHVDDDGPGVPEQRLEQIFEPRFRLSPRGQGYGLGLGIARNIAHTHGGEVSLQNRREGGLRVSLRLPRLGLE